MSELNPRERELATALRDTLEQAASRHDPLLDAALAATRAQIAAQPVRHRHPWWLAGGFAVAASLAVVLVLPFGQGPSTPLSRPVATTTVNAGASTVAAMPDADLQLLEDMDMLAAMGESRHEG